MEHSDSIWSVLRDERVITRLAQIEHERWTHWQRYLHDKCDRLEDGSLVIPPDLVWRWEDQVEASYDQLSEQERESDREQVQRYLPVVIEEIVRILNRSPVTDTGAQDD